MRNVTEQAVHIVDAVQLREYCNTKTAIPADDHEPFVAFYQITGTYFTVQIFIPNCNNCIFCQQESLRVHFVWWSFGQQRLCCAGFSAFDILILCNSCTIKDVNSFQNMNRVQNKYKYKQIYKYKVKGHCPLLPLISCNSYIQIQYWPPTCTNTNTSTI